MSSFYIANENGDWWEASAGWGRTLYVAKSGAMAELEPDDIDEHAIREAGKAVSLDSLLSGQDLLALLRKANADRDRAEYALADYKRSVYTHVAQVYEEACEMFDADALPGFITELAKAHGVPTVDEVDEYEGYPAYECDHEYNHTVGGCSTHEISTTCQERTCDNCKAVLEHEDA